jgi:hypothetical protein
MQEAIEAIHATIEVATRQGLARARIALQPQELGDIHIHLSQTSEGLMARVVTQTQAAAQALAEGHSELRQSLSSLGVSLLRLDIGSFEHPDARAGDHRSSERDHTPTGGRSVPAEAPETVLAPDRGGEACEPTSGGLVDVLA